MATSSQPFFRHLRSIAFLALAFCVPGVSAAAGFIVGSNIKSGASIAEISIQLACAVEYVDHFPTGSTDRLRINIESTAICNGVSPTIASTREQHRPLDADKAKLVEISYDGDTPSGQSLTLAFSEDVRFDIIHAGTSNDLVVRVYLNSTVENALPTPGVGSTRVTRIAEPDRSYVINLSSSRTQHAMSELQSVAVAPGLELFESEVLLAGTTWYRLRLGRFKSTADAQVELSRLRSRYPTAWIDLASDGEGENQQLVIAEAPQESGEDNVFASIGLDEIDQLMTDARRAMVAGEIPRAVQIYTKVLRAPNHDRHAQAQEYLALAREKNGQLAHAKAEYQRYLSEYPDDEGVLRVNQRLAALLATDRQASAIQPGGAQSTGSRTPERQSNWRIQSFVSQYYRRDVNQPNEEDDIVSQSSLYSDVNIDARRRGERFDFSSRLSAGYRNDFLGEDQGSSGDVLRVSYAYANLADARTGLTGRIGRQSRNTGGILGRFDGVNLGYQATEQILVSTVSGIPVNSAADGIDSERRFYGLSVDYLPPIDNLELGVFYIAQDIEGVDDRQAVGGEFRYFGENQNLWGLVDYDTVFNELGSAFLQGSWRITPHLSVHGSMNRRHSPYLSTRNAMIGQPVLTFEEMLVLWTPEEIHQLSIDRSPLSTSYTFGLSQSFSPKLQINFDANETTIDATPASGGISATPQSNYRYFSTTFVASSLIKEGDVSMIGIRVSDSDTTKVISLNLDSRFPFGRSWRVNPRLRVDRRQIMSDSSDEWLYTPGIRVQFRKSQKFRLEFEAGKQFIQRHGTTVNLDRESYFVNLGYQAFF